MNDGVSARQQIVEKIKGSSTILVTLSKDANVDELSAALGLTAMLNNMKKHATAVVSGIIPPAIDFLEPGKTFENTVDSLRDFIIALDKEKADHLRYKVDGDVVKIFITPYRTTINQDDLDFSQGDYNVELVLALGVKDEGHLDTALEAHGRILHDATVATLTCGDDSSDLGSLAWHESGASSISEMLVALSEALKTDKPLLDEQISTAFLTGIVAATDRFSNNKTSSKVMTMAAQLMAAGANQQLIAAKLSEAHEISANDSSQDDDTNNDGTTNLTEDSSSKVDRDEKKSSKSKKAAEQKDENKEEDGALNIAHEPQGSLDDVARETQKKGSEEATERAEDALAKQLSSVAPAATATDKPSLEDLQSDIASASTTVDQAAEQSAFEVKPSDASMPAYEPTLGGTLNATTDQAEGDKRADAQNQQNHTILSHGQDSLASSDANDTNGPTFVAPPFSAATTPSTPADDAQPLSSELPPLPAFDQSPTVSSSEPTLADIDSAHRAPRTDALAAVHAAFDGGETTDAAPLSPVAPQPTGSIAPPLSIPAPSVTGLPPLPDFAAPPPPPTPPVAPFAPVADDTDNLGQIFPSPDPATSTPPTAPDANDPAQFTIPGQPKF